MTEGLEYEHVNKFLMEVETMVILLVLLVLFCTICICVSNHENIGRTWTFKKHSKDVPGRNVSEEIVKQQEQNVILYMDSKSMYLCPTPNSMKSGIEL